MSLSNNFPTISPSLLLDFANTKRLDPRVTFTRSTTAVYYDGVTTALAEQNLLTWSQDFDNAAWSRLNVTVSPNNGLAPDGTTTADLVYPSTTGVSRTIYQAGPGTTTSSVTSFYAKASGKSWIWVVGAVGSGTSGVYFNVSTGTKGFEFPGYTGTITPVGNGWYRLVVQNPSTAMNFGQITIVDADNTNSVTANGTDGILVWGAQLEQRSSVTAYTPTTTTSITNYIPQLLTAAANVPRFDFNPTTGESLGLLIEEQRTNLLLYSSDFDNAAWVKVNTSINANTVIAPDGTLSGDKLIITSTAAQHILYQNVTTVTSQAYAQTFYIKKAEWSQRIRFSTVSGNVVLSLATTQPTFVSGDSTPTITDVGNGWYRVSIVAVEDSGGSVQVGRIVFQDNSGGENFAGDNFSGIYIWGAQFEAATFPTSYIPTVASTVQRNADLASMTGTAFSSWYNPNQGTLYTEGGGLNAASSARLASITDNTFSNRIINYFATSGLAAGLITTSGVSQANPVVSITSATALNKVIQGYALNNVNIAANGTLGTLDTSATIPAVTLMRIGVDEVGTGSFLNGTIRKIAYYPVRLTDAQLQALTL